MNGLTGFLFGLVFGGMIGFFVACLMIANGRDKE